MSTFKKVVSLMLCFAMLLGTVAIAGNSIVAPKAYAAEAPVSGIDSYADLAAKYDNFVYLGLEFYEKNSDGEYTLTDYKVQPGQPHRQCPLPHQALSFFPRHRKLLTKNILHHTSSNQPIPL